MFVSTRFSFGDLGILSMEVYGSVLFEKEVHHTGEVRSYLHF